MDGNRRPNYDGQLLPPVFIADGYEKPLTHDLRGYYGGSRNTAFRSGKPASTVKQWWHDGSVPGGDGDGDGSGATGKGPGSGLLDRSGPGFKTGKNKSGLFSFSTLGGAGGDAGRDEPAPKSGLPRGPYKGSVMKNKGRGRGGLFGTHSYMPEGADDKAKSRSGSRTGGGRWRVTGTRGGLFDSNPNRHVPTSDRPKKMYNMSDYRPKSVPGRGVFRDTNKNLHGTLGSFPSAIPDPYDDAPAMGSLPRRGFVTYKNITRVARQGKSLY